jgi:hypothetical protein
MASLEKMRKDIGLFENALGEEIVKARERANDGMNESALHIEEEHHLLEAIECD